MANRPPPHPKVGFFKTIRLTGLGSRIVAEVQSQPLGSRREMDFRDIPETTPPKSTPQRRPVSNAGVCGQ
jgi:hypothetical protein